MSADVDPVTRPASLTDLAYQQLKSKVLSGGLLGNERLSVVALAKRMQMSRSPVRSAVERLAAEGLVQLEPGGVSIIRPTPTELFQTLQVRSVLEGLAARLATPHMNADLLEELDEIQRSFEEAVNEDDVARARALDLQFHQKVMSQSDNPVLIEELHRVQARVIVGTYSVAWSAQQKAAVPEHRVLIEGLRSGDSLRAEEAAVSHMEELIKRILSSSKS